MNRARKTARSVGKTMAAPVIAALWNEIIMKQNWTLYLIAITSAGIVILREIFPTLRFDGISLTLLGIAALAMVIPRLIELLPPIKKAKYKEFEIEFEKEIKALEHQVVEIEKEAVESEQQGTAKYPPLHTTYIDEYQSIISSKEPNIQKVLRAAILTENIVLQAAKDLNIALKNNVRAPSSIIRILFKEGFITQKEQSVFNSFWELRNKVIHGHLADLSDSQTTRIMSLLWRLITIFG